MGIKITGLGPYLAGLGLLLISSFPQAMAQTIVATPGSIEVLTPTTDRYMSQVTIVSPKEGETMVTEVPLKIAVQRFPAGKDNYKVRYALNGQSTNTIDRKELYLTGWKIGQNQLVVELFSASGQVADNAGYNRVERTITFQPNGTDSLSKLIRGEFTPEQMFGALGPEPFVYDNAGNPKLLKPAN